MRRVGDILRLYPGDPWLVLVTALPSAREPLVSGVAFREDGERAPIVAEGRSIATPVVVRVNVRATNRAELVGRFEITAAWLGLDEDEAARPVPLCAPVFQGGVYLHGERVDEGARRWRQRAIGTRRGAAGGGRARC